MEGKKGGQEAGHRDQAPHTAQAREFRLHWVLRVTKGPGSQDHFTSGGRTVRPSSG